ncbi:hypothetical protein HZC34_06395 [Candidatus Saganbacteria bacterium]|nr:hypothetical protein [Candidatus Saganbacteria bacterium]
MAELKTNTNLYVRLISSWNLFLKKDELKKIGDTNDKGDGSADTFVYAKFSGNVVVIKDKNDKSADQTFTKIDLSDGLSFEELMALGIDPKQFVLVRTIARGWHLDGDKTAQKEPEASNIDDVDLLKFDNAVKEYARSRRMAYDEALNAFTLGSQKLELRTEEMGNWDKNIEFVEAFLADKTKGITDAIAFLLVVKNELNIKNNGNPILLGFFGYIEDWQMSDGMRKKVAGFLIKIAIASQWSESFQRTIFNLSYPIKQKYRGQMDFESLKAWAQAVDSEAVPNPNIPESLRTTRKPSLPTSDIMPDETKAHAWTSLKDFVALTKELINSRKGKRDATYLATALKILETSAKSKKSFIRDFAVLGFALSNALLEDAKSHEDLDKIIREIFNKIPDDVLVGYRCLYSILSSVKTALVFSKDYKKENNSVLKSVAAELIAEAIMALKGASLIPGDFSDLQFIRLKLYLEQAQLAKKAEGEASPFLAHEKLAAYGRWAYPVKRDEANLMPQVKARISRLKAEIDAEIKSDYSLEASALIENYRRQRPQIIKELLKIKEEFEKINKRPNGDLAALIGRIERFSIIPAERKEYEALLTEAQVYIYSFISDLEMAGSRVLRLKKKISETRNLFAASIGKLRPELKEKILGQLKALEDSIQNSEEFEASYEKFCDLLNEVKRIIFF